MKRVMLFIATNLAIVIVLSITLRLLGVERFLDAQGVGLDLKALLVFATVFGMGHSTPQTRRRADDIDPGVSAELCQKLRLSAVAGPFVVITARPLDV